MIERRNDARRRVLLGGLVETAAYLPEIACIVRDVSLAGAKIRISADAILPERVVLRVPLRGEARLGRVVWRDGDLVGLRFGDDSADEVEDAGNAPSRTVPFAGPGGTVH